MALSEISANVPGHLRWFPLAVHATVIPYFAWRFSSLLYYTNSDFPIAGLFRVCTDCVFFKVVKKKTHFPIKDRNKGPFTILSPFEEWNRIYRWFGGREEKFEFVFFWVCRISLYHEEENKVFLSIVGGINFMGRACRWQWFLFYFLSRRLLTSCAFPESTGSFIFFLSDRMWSTRRLMIQWLK